MGGGNAQKTAMAVSFGLCVTLHFVGAANSSIMASRSALRSRQNWQRQLEEVSPNIPMPLQGGKF
jgi:hypothetical protein